ncbi:hypothetical protein CJ030_MR2G013612 [Morella rubra]|uniref:Pentatricopeptide repeat-containing protein, chloroplastic n=1 Tax=Morella rubra TaxID=262757 RepID=A0A6A1WGW5_9ROSI|nr:hypothetical protein CJ030_MR2G013612 [Morella rubra]
MVGFVMTNSQMGVSYFERSGLFASNYNCNSIPWRPIFPNCSSVRKIRVLSVKLQNSGIISALKEESDNRLVGGGLIEKELEFKPAFSEYVKTMELVRVRRDKNQANDRKKHKQRGDSTEKDLSRTFPTEGGEETVKLEEFECCLEEEKTFKVVERESLSVHEYGGMGKESCVGGKLSYKGKGTKQFKYENDARDGNVNTRLGKKPGGGTPKVILSKHKTVMTGQEMDNSHMDRSSKARNAQKSSRSLGPVQSKRHSIDVEGQRVYDANSLGMLRKKGNEGGHGDPKSPWKTFKEEKIGVRRDKVQGRLEKKYIQVEEEANNRFLYNYGKFTRGSRASSERIHGDGLEVERAAFKTFDESNDVVDKPRVSRMEMEERIQRLANLLNGAAIDMPEWMFAKMMRSARIRFSDHSVLRIIQLLGKLGNWRRVLEVIEWLQIRERFKSHKLRFIYTTALDVLGKANRPVEALNVFHSMQQHMSSYPDIVAYHCIAVTLGQAGYLKELFDVIDTMRSPPKKKFKTGALGEWDLRLEPDVIVYNSISNSIT